MHSEESLFVLILSELHSEEYKVVDLTPTEALVWSPPTLTP